MRWKAKIYKTHKIIGLIVFIPVFFWAFSGLMHPFMSNWFRPTMANTHPPQIEIDTNKLVQSIPTILKQNNIDSFSDIQLVSINSSATLQVIDNGSQNYFDCKSGEKIVDGEKVYAEELARYFLQDSKSSIVKMEVLDQFDTHYKYINRLLPVWKVTFDRPDGMVLYIETSSSRLGTFNNKYRRAYISIFSALHNWSFIPGSIKIQHTVVAIFSFLLFLGAVLGVFSYVILWKSRKVSKKSSHRKWGIAFSLVLLMFSFSGFYHVFVKLDGKKSPNVETPVFQTNALQFDLKNIISNKTINGLSVCQIGSEIYYQIKEGKNWHYFSASNGQKIKNGEIEFAKNVVAQLDPNKSIIKTSKIEKFGGEYGFINKRLPVIKVDVQSKDNTSYYVETWTGKLATKITDSDRAEGISFAMFHKYHFLDPMGRNFRDIVAVLFSIFIMIVAYKGVSGIFRK